MFPLTIHRLRSMFAGLNGCCLVNPLRSLSFQELSCSLALFYTPGLDHALLQSTNYRVVYIESHSSLSTTCYHFYHLPSLCIRQFSTCHVEIKFRKFKVLPVLQVQILILKKPAKLEFCNGTGGPVSSFFN